MRVALVSDVHGNLRGLDACLADLAEQGGADLLVGAGDYCVDGPHPREVLERLAQAGATCVRGNTDRTIAQAPLATSGEEEEGEAAQLAWQREQLGEGWTRWLGALPFAHRVGENGDALLVVHATPKRDDEHIWPDADDAFLERATADVVERTLAFGHLHLPYVRVWRDRLFVNVSSAGLPKDGDARAGYAIFTRRSGGWEVKHRRVPFDVESVVRDIEKSGMPGREKRISVLRRHRYKELNGPIP
jgi:predicted phosphodiesterase